MKYLAYLNILFGDNHVQNSGNCKKMGDALRTTSVLKIGLKKFNIAIFRMCYGENGTVNFFETLADNVFRHNYSMVHRIKKIPVN
jgi:hypothetical protein